MKIKKKLMPDSCSTQKTNPKNEFSENLEGGVQTEKYQKAPASVKRSAKKAPTKRSQKKFAS